jgi:hypothetical protein
MLKKILLVLLVFLILAQFIQPPKNNGPAATPNDITHVVQVPDTVMSLLKQACYDCHSNNTRYPWYNRITPVNWWLRHHVNEGKRELNFSEFAKGSFRRKIRKLDETAEQVEKHEMPISSYTWIHKDARLNDAERKLLIDWANTAKAKVEQDSLQAASNPK